MQKILLVRHGLDDRNTINRHFNAPLIKKGIIQSVIASCNIKYLLEDAEANIICSPKLRTLQTAKIMQYTLSTSGCHTKLFIDKSVVDFGQGVIRKMSNISISAQAKMLQTARDANYYQYRILGNLDYKFGAPFDNDRFTAMNGLIEAYGETQREYLMRLYEFLINLLSWHSCKQAVIVTHKVVIWRIRQILESIDRDIDENDVDEPNYRHGQIVCISINNVDHAINVIMARLVKLQK